MLKFEFIQPGEFVDPYYHVIDGDGGLLGSIEWEAGECWVLFNMWSDYYARSCDLSQIVNKLDELNKSTRAQRVLWGWL